VLPSWLLRKATPVLNGERSRNKFCVGSADRDIVQPDESGLHVEVKAAFLIVSGKPKCENPFAGCRGTGSVDLVSEMFDCP
jgi:hypothetical protein